MLTREGFIRRHSHNPSTNAELELPFPDSPFLQQSSAIQVDGRIPVVTDIFVSGNESIIFKERENILISVEFSSEVIVLGGPPVLAVSIGDKYPVEAPYIAGNRSKIFQFLYSVAVGDMSPPFPLACQMICVATGCVQGVSHEGYIKQYSSNSSLDANLDLPHPKNGEMKLLS